VARYVVRAGTETVVVDTRAQAVAIVRRARSRGIDAAFHETRIYSEG